VIQKEINEELVDGTVKLSTVIQVLRTDNPIYENYRPIIDWYYDDKTQMEGFLLRPEFPKMVQRKISEEKMKYLTIQHKLEEIKVSELIREMDYHSKPNISHA
jgi:hypothetical protein